LKLNNKIQNLIKAALAILVISNVSCGDMDSIHEEYLQGENIYAGKLDTLKIRPGFYRAQLEGQTQFLGNSNQVIVEYEDQVDIYPLESGTINDGIFSLILPNLDEKSYEFSITTQDPSGNLSVSQAVAGSVVGDIFVSDQDPREVEGFSFEADGAYVNFYGNAESEYVMYTLVDYENENSEIVRDTAFYEDNRVKLVNLKPLGDMYTTSVIQSGLNGIDSLALDPLSYTLPDLPYTELDKNFIRMVNMPSDNPGTFNNADPENYLFDDNASWNGDDTYSYNSGPGSLPFHFTVDLGVETDLRKVKLDMLDPSVNANNNITDIQIWGRDDLDFAQTTSSDVTEFINAGWQLLYDGQVDGFNSQSQSFIMAPVSSKKRYIRVRVAGSVGGESAQLTELTFYGENTEPIELDKSLFNMASMPSDNPGTFYGANPLSYLWDNNNFWSGDAYGYHSGENSVPGHFTLDLGVTTQLARAKFDFRPTWNYAGNNPNEIEIWGIGSLSAAETLPVFQSSGNNVVSNPVTTASFEEAGWQLITQQTVDGANSNSAEFEISEGQMYRYIRIRWVSTVAGSGCQFIEMTFYGMGAFPSD